MPVDLAKMDRMYKTAGFRASQYRDHRGSLADSMATARPVSTWAELEQAVAPFVPLDVRYYAYDDRIQWDSYVVMGCAPDFPAEMFVLGFTNGPLSRDGRITLAFDEPEV